ncbi:hypothetical protein VNO77_18821 [Canavalia gladiata]|uniref:Late embryogenesis abundant protein LEA-2 subgroup domain-containing protein n=1 Tax=Canavalia gladiata TaxID=3824 RepID=A0AAN9LLI5_CANGL
MDVSASNSDCFWWKELHPGFSFKKCCFFLLIFLLITCMVVGLATFFVILIVRPHKPVFSVREVQINFYKIDDRSNLTLLVSSVISLTLNAENHNKFGIGFSPSRFLVYQEGLHIGTIRIPWFFQPPHTENVTVPSRVLLQCVNLSKIVANTSLQEMSKQNTAPIKITGDARVHVWVLHIKLFEIKIALDCGMNFNIREFAFTNEAFGAKISKSDLGSVLSDSKGISMKCASAVYI